MAWNNIHYDAKFQSSSSSPSWDKSVYVKKQNGCSVNSEKCFWLINTLNFDSSYTHQTNMP